MKRFLGVILIFGSLAACGPGDEEIIAGVTYANCAEVEAAGAAPINEGDPGYSPALDRDGDGVGCEQTTTTVDPLREQLDGYWGGLTESQQEEVCGAQMFMTREEIIGVVADYLERPVTDVEADAIMSYLNEKCG